MKRQEFTTKVKLQAWERANGRCEKCTAKLFPGNIAFDHIVPCAFGGEPVLLNCSVLCRSCHDGKTYRKDLKDIAKGKRIRRKHIGVRGRTSFHGWRRFDGSIVRADDRE